MRPRIREAIIVEGRYDKNTLLQTVDALVVETGGFSALSDSERIAFFRKLAAERGVVILTDGDGAGFLIRGRLKGALPPDRVKHAYIPDVYGRERRKKTSSAEGKLGVEGMTPEVLLEALRRAGCTFEDVSDTPPPAGDEVTRPLMIELGLSGGEHSSMRRAALARSLGLPERISSKGLFEAVRALMSAGELREAVKKLQ